MTSKSLLCSVLVMGFILVVVGPGVTANSHGGGGGGETEMESDTESHGHDVRERCKIDLAIVVDASGSICGDKKMDTCENWRLTLGFVENIIRNVTIGPDDVQVALVIFGNVVYPKWLLSSSMTQDDMIELIESLYTAYDPLKNTQTDDALRVVMGQIFNVNNGDRPDVNNVMILLTDGKPTEPDKAIAEAQELHATGTRALVVGVTSQISKETIEKLSSRPSRQLERTYFLSPNFKELQGVLSKLIEASCTLEIRTEMPTTTTTTTATTTTTTTMAPTTTQTTPSPTRAPTTTNARTESSTPSQAPCDPCNACPFGFIYNKDIGSCYHIVRRKMDWNTAKQHCLDIGSYLVEVGSVDELRALQLLYESVFTYDGNAFWTGGMKPDEVMESDGDEEMFIWDNSKRHLSADSGLFMPGKPNGVSQAQDRIILEVECDGEAGLNVYGFNTKQFFICEVHASGPRTNA